MSISGFIAITGSLCQPTQGLVNTAEGQMQRLDYRYVYKVMIAFGSSYECARRHVLLSTQRAKGSASYSQNSSGSGGHIPVTEVQKLYMKQKKTD